MAGASRIAKKHLTLMWKLPASDSHLACPSFYRGVIKYGEIHGLSLRRPSRGLPATGLYPILLLLSGLAFLVIFYTWLSLVFEGISVQRRCCSFRKVLMLVSGIHAVLSGSLIDATTRGKIIVHCRLTAGGRSARRIVRIYLELVRTIYSHRPNLLHIVAISTYIYIYISLSEQLYYLFINFHLLISLKIHLFEKSI